MKTECYCRDFSASTSVYFQGLYLSKGTLPWPSQGPCSCCQWSSCSILTVFFLYLKLTHLSCFMSNRDLSIAQFDINEPPHDKTNKMACAPSGASDQPGHRPSLIRVFAVRMKKATLATHWVHSEDSDHTGRMSRLIWVFDGLIVILLVLSWGYSNVHVQPLNRAGDGALCLKRPLVSYVVYATV